MGSAVGDAVRLVGTVRLLVGVTVGYGAGSAVGDAVGTGNGEAAVHVSEQSSELHSPFVRPTLCRAMGSAHEYGVG